MFRDRDELDEVKLINELLIVRLARVPRRPRKKTCRGIESSGFSERLPRVPQRAAGIKCLQGELMKQTFRALVPLLHCVRSSGV